MGNIKNDRTCIGYTNVWFTPIGIRSLVKTLYSLDMQDLKGLIHVSGNCRISKFDFGKEVESILDKKNLVLAGFSNSEEAMREIDLSLCNCKLQKLSLAPKLSWKDELRNYLEEWKRFNVN